MTPLRRRSLLVGLGLGAAAALVLSLGLQACGGDEDDGVTLDSGANSELPVAGDVTGEPLPDQAFETFDGGEASFADYRGTPVVVNVWQSTCAPCVKEMPAFEAVHQQLGEQVAFVGLNHQDYGNPEAMVDKTGVTYDLFRDPLGDFFVEMELAAMPTTVFADADGNVVATRAGAMDEAELLRIIEQELLS
jgi:thiol-disulfide isomerase/thioredoxin